jgi:hypothetical protein
MTKNDLIMNEFIAFSPLPGETKSRGEDQDRSTSALATEFVSAPVALQQSRTLSRTRRF